MSVAVIDFKKENCVNCHACITVCPAKFCNDGSKQTVNIEPDRCIGCGACIAVCKHDARSGYDDFELLQQGLQNKEAFIAIVMPSVAASFQEKMPHLIGWLQEQGIEAVFDGSVGADLYLQSYRALLEKPDQTPTIAPTCPSLNRYIQLYYPDLINVIAPIASPVIHSINMIRRHFEPFMHHKLVVLSSCLSIQYELQALDEAVLSVGYLALQTHFKKQYVDLNKVNPAVFDGPKAEKGSLVTNCSSLKEIFSGEKELKNRKIRSIDGVATSYPYINKMSKSIKNNTAPFILDCFSCTNGCPGGPVAGTENEPADELDWWMHNRNIKDSEDGKQTKTLASYWQEQDSKGIYDSLEHLDTIREPDPKSLQAIFHTMLKYDKKDFYNCTSCGYLSCKKMGKAIFNRLNRPENCYVYLLKKNLQMEEKESRYEKMLANGAEGFIQVDQKLKIIDTNAAFSSMLGIPLSALKGKYLYEFVNEETKALLIRHSSLSQGQESSSYMLEMKPVSGKLLVCMLNSSTLTDENGVFVGSFAMISDITDLIKAERELRNSKKNLKIMIDGAPIGILLINKNNQVEQANQAAAKLAGFGNAKDLEGIDVNAMLCLSEDSSCPYDEFGIRLEESERLLITIDGKYIPVLESRSSLDIDGEPFVLYTFTDITKIKEAEQLTLEMKEALEEKVKEKTKALQESLQHLKETQSQLIQTEKMAALGNLVAGVAHEINTPVGIGITLSSNLQDEAEKLKNKYKKEKLKRSDFESFMNLTKESARMMLENLKHGADLVKSFKQIAVDQTSEQKRAFKLRSYIIEILKSFKNKLQRLNINVLVNIPDNILLDSYPGAFSQIITNFLMNSIVHAFQGKEDGLIVFETKIEEKVMLLKYADNGKGMPDSYRQKIFDPFFTTRRGSGGSGLGMHIVFNLVTKKLGGTIECKSNLDQGTEFIITLEEGIWTYER